MNGSPLNRALAFCLIVIMSFIAACIVWAIAGVTLSWANEGAAWTNQDWFISLIVGCLGGLSVYTGLIALCFGIEFDKDEG